MALPSFIKLSFPVVSLGSVMRGIVAVSVGIGQGFSEISMKMKEKHDPMNSVYDINYKVVFLRLPRERCHIFGQPPNKAPQPVMHPLEWG